MKKGWEIKKIGEIILENKKSTLKSKGNEEGIYPFFISGMKIKSCNKSIIDGQNIFLPTGGNFYVHFYNGKASYSTDTWCIRTNGNVDIKYLYFYLVLNRDFINKKYFKGATIKHLQKTDLKNIEIPIPPLSEQKQIVSILDKAFADIAKAKDNAEQNLKNAKELFESYLQGVFKNKGDDWEDKMIKEIGIAQTGTTPKTSNKENSGDFIPFIKPADINIKGNGEIRYDNDGLSEQGLENGRKMLTGSILMVCIGATIGKVGFVDRDVSSNQQINSLTVNKEFSPKFFYYALSTKDFFKQVIHNSAQATLPIINKSKWEALIVSFPKSKIKQEDIVNKLNSLQKETKKLEIIYQNKIKDLEELKKSILQKAFNGELKSVKI